jgi:hypothetical protein
MVDTLPIFDIIGRVFFYFMETSLHKTIEDWIFDHFPDEDIILADGMEEAFIGIATQFNTSMAIYDVKKCIRGLINEGMTSEEAEEWFSFNTQGAYVGENTPAFLLKFPKYKKFETSTKHIAEQFTFKF